MSNDRYNILLTVVDLMGEETEGCDPCPVCSKVVERLKKALLLEGERIIEATRAEYAMV